MQRCRLNSSAAYSSTGTEPGGGRTTTFWTPDSAMMKGLEREECVDVPCFIFILPLLRCTFNRRARKMPFSSGKAVLLVGDDGYFRADFLISAIVFREASISLPFSGQLSTPHAPL